MNHPLTKRQREVLDVITVFTAANGYAPTYDEIRQALKLRSLTTVSKHLDALEAKHCIGRERNGKRSIRLLRRCPTCGCTPGSRPA